MAHTYSTFNSAQKITFSAAEKDNPSFLILAQVFEKGLYWNLLKKQAWNLKVLMRAVHEISLPSFAPKIKPVSMNEFYSPWWHQGKYKLIR